VANPFDELRDWIDESESKLRSRRDSSVVALMYEGFRQVASVLDSGYVSSPIGSMSFKTAASLNVVAGGTPVGTVTDIQTLQDGNEYNLPEAAATPGYDLEINFTGVTRIDGVVVASRYTGSAAHTSDFRLYNYDNTTDDVFFLTPTASANNYRTVIIPNGASYFDGSGNAQATFYHTSGGVPSHDLYIDYIALLSWDV